MDAFKPVKSQALPLNRADVDTDQIIPAKYLKRIERSGFGQFLFDSWRKDPDFVLNDARYKGSEILLTGPNFGCGSSREHAPWAIQDAGFKVIISPSFADIFRNNCAKIGLLTVVLPKDEVEKLIARAEETPAAEIVVDLETQQVTTGDGRTSVHFEIDSFVKHCLLNGLDDIGLTMHAECAISKFEAKRPEFFPATIGTGR